MAYACKILADSISPAGHRLTSIEATFPRIILCEVNTHNMLSKSSASSRAIPVQKRIAAIKADSFVPDSFGRNQKGMQPGEVLSGNDARRAADIWRTAQADALYHSERLAAIEVHKQLANRLPEAFAWHTAVLTGTDWSNFFNLRVNPDAQGEFQTIASMMKAAYEASAPRPINYGEWHTPYVEPAEYFNLEVENRLEPWKISVGRCARTSYLTQDGVRDPAKDVALYDERLLPSGHMSPLEHVARPMDQDELILTRAYDVAFDDGPVVRIKTRIELNVGEEIVLASGRRARVAHLRGPLNYAGKLNGWISRRQFIRGEHDILGHRSTQL